MSRQSDQVFPRVLRLRTRDDFQRVYACDAFAADAVLVIRGCLNGREDSRLGLSVSRKVGNAIVRNHWKRLIREAFRRSRHELPSGLDLIVRPRRGAQPGFAPIQQSLVSLSRRLARGLSRGER